MARGTSPVWMDILLTLASVQIPVHFFPCIMAGISQETYKRHLFSFFGLEIPLQNGAMARIWPFVPLAAAR
jgi:hypothetical protein